MILDNELVYKDGYALSGGTGATDVVDHGAGGDALVNEPVLVVNVSEAAAGGTSVTVALQTAADAAFTSPVTLWTSQSKALAAMTLGKKLCAVRFPRGLKRYSRCYVTATGTFTAGKLNIFAVTGEDHSFKDIEG